MESSLLLLTGALFPLNTKAVLESLGEWYVCDAQEAFWGDSVFKIFAKIHIIKFAILTIFKYTLSTFITIHL